ncbi:MAG: lipoyl(octanoyl) transferase LipB [Chthoniobacterales bacterium]|nr:lipoyl(octanoyl) transferase LipB [Chthoniobacterales bacterium]
MDIKIRFLGRIDYAAALREQEACLERVANKETNGEILLLEHEPVFTIGRTRNKSSLHLFPVLPFPVFEISRGGQATYHGPGQLVVYPILDMARFNRDLHHYLRWLEEFLIGFCALYGVRATRREGLTGCWVNERKIASIGVGVRRWISMHGFAINILPTALEGFRYIIPCGIQGVQMTDLSTEANQLLSVQEAANSCAKFFFEKLKF